MFSIADKRVTRALTSVLPALLLAGCFGQGEGPTPIAGTPAPPPPEIPEGFCDPINFEDLCGPFVFTEFEGGPVTIIDNPDVNDLNPTDKVARMQKFAAESGLTFGGSTLALPGGMDFSNGEAFTMLVWASREVPVLFKFEGLNQERELNHSGSGGWEELCFDFTGTTDGPPATGITFIFDVNVLGDAANDPDNWTFYFDEITQVESCGGGGGPDPGPGTLGPVDFEAGGQGENFAWTVFENDDNPPLEIIDNPDASGVNTSARVAQFSARQAGQPFAGFFTQDLPTFTLDATNATVKIKVWKSVISNVGIKFEDASTGSTGEILVPNTVVNQWEELTFDFSGVIGDPVNTDITTLVIFPDFDARAADNVIYIDDITFNAVDSGGGPGAGITPDFVLFGTTAPADVPIPDFVQDVSGPQNFGSGATFDFAFADTSFDPSIAVTAGNGYGADVWVAFIAVNGYANPIAAGFDTFNAKVKGSPDGRIEVKLIGNGADSVATIDTATYAGATDLGDGWFQLEIPLSEFTEQANIAGHTGWLVGPPGDQGDAAFNFLLTDVGFSNAGGGNAGITPEFVLFGTTAPADVAIPDFVQDVSGPQNFGSGATFDFAFADTTYDPVIAVTAGNGYGADVWVAFIAVNGYANPIAAGFDIFNAKVKGSPDGRIEVKLIGNGADSVVTVDTATYAGATDLGDGWFQLEIPLSEFTEQANIAGHTGWLIGPPGDQGDAAFNFLLTDVGFSNAGT